MAPGKEKGILSNARATLTSIRSVSVYIRRGSIQRAYASIVKVGGAIFFFAKIESDSSLECGV